MRDEKGVVALMTVAFLAFVGVFAIALVLASARINNSYTLLNNAAQSAAFSAVTAAKVDDQGKALIPCPDADIAEVRSTYSGCLGGDSYQAAQELLQAAFADSPGGFCFPGPCDGTPVYMGEEGNSWIQVFNTEPGASCQANDFQIERDAVPLSDDLPPRFLCWVVRENRFEKPYAIRYSSGVIVRLQSKVDLFLFRDRTINVYAGATISQGE